MQNKVRAAFISDLFWHLLREKQASVLARLLSHGANDGVAWIHFLASSVLCPACIFPSDLFPLVFPVDSRKTKQGPWVEAKNLESWVLPVCSAFKSLFHEVVHPI